MESRIAPLSFVGEWKSVQDYDVIFRNYRMKVCEKSLLIAVIGIDIEMQRLIFSWKRVLLEDVIMFRAINHRSDKEGVAMNQSLNKRFNRLCD